MCGAEVRAGARNWLPCETQHLFPSHYSGGLEPRAPCQLLIGSSNSWTTVTPCGLVWSAGSWPLQWPAVSTLAVNLARGTTPHGARGWRCGFGSLRIDLLALGSRASVTDAPARPVCPVRRSQPCASATHPLLSKTHPSRSREEVA